MFDLFNLAQIIKYVSFAFLFLALFIFLKDRSSQVVTLFLNVKDKSGEYLKGYVIKGKEDYNKKGRFVYKSKKGLIYYLNVVISRAGFINIMNAQLLISLSFVFAVICFLSLRGSILDIYVSLLVLMLPFIALLIISQINSNRIEKYILFFLETLRNYMMANISDPMTAFELAYIHAKPAVFQKMVNHFVSDVKFFKRNIKDSFEAHKDAVDINTYSEFLDNIYQCLIYGGNSLNIIDKTIDKLNKLQEAKAKRLHQINMVRIVMLFLLICNFLFFIYYYQTQRTYFYMVFQNRVIMGVEFINIYLVLFLAYFAGKMDM